SMPVRFDDPGPAAYAAFFDKRIIDPSDPLDQPSAAVPLAALCFLTARDPSADRLRLERLQPSAAVRRLLDHATPDPLGTAPAVPPALQRAVGGLATRVEAVALTLPDRFDRLDASAAALDSLAAEPKAGA
ncbi:MAG TPA: hypothetical protein VFR28_05570, partial [Allosphingosinicella sp.]|nr:hypothetical protein [Allosphingosinicella sp.]